MCAIHLDYTKSSKLYNSARFKQTLIIGMDKEIEAKSTRCWHSLNIPNSVNGNGFTSPLSLG